MIHVFSSSSRLKPFTSYQFRIKATNDIGDSEYSQESEAITTLQDGRSIPQHKVIICCFSTVLYKSPLCEHAFAFML